jgi:RimJ/RimL family protein N-acetyltransferase
MDAQIRVLTEQDAAQLFRLRRRALLDAPYAFVSAPADDLVSSEQAARKQLRRGGDAAVYGAFTDGLAGMLGWYRSRHLKEAHKVFLWGMFVVPEARRRGLGRALLDAVIAHASALPGSAALYLGVSSGAPAARTLYEQAGFSVWGTDRDAIRVDGRSYDEHHMVRRIAPD